MPPAPASERPPGTPFESPAAAGAPLRAAERSVSSALRIAVRERLASSRGQASVELVVLLPVILVVLAVAYQALLAGQAIWEVRVAARAAARAHSVGADASAAARAHLPGELERGLRVRTADDGDVRVSVRVPTVLPAVRLGRVSATSHFRPQGG